MTVRIKTALPWVAAFAFVLASIASATACQYCRMGGDPKACLDLIRTDRSGELRLDAVIDKFQTAPVQAAPLTVVTNAAELPLRTARRPVPVITAAPPPSPVQTHVLDGGLIGMAVAGGIFCWRTRSTERP